MQRSIKFVSVIIPCYNDGKLIHEAIESVLNQTCQNFEILIIDDGSKDNETIQVLRNLDTPKTKVYRKENGGPASARNFGIGKSKGQFILTLDADDKFAPDFLKKGLEILDSKPQVGMVTSYITRIYKNSEIKAKLSGGDVSAFVIKNEASASLLYRYKCWEDAGGYDEDIPGFEDWEFALNVTKQGWTVHSIPEYLFFYSGIENSQYSKDLLSRPEIIKYLINKHEDIFIDNMKEILLDRELQLHELKEKVSKFENSYSQLIGNAIIKPVKAIRDFFYLTER